MNSPFQFTVELKQLYVVNKEELVKPLGELFEGNSPRSLFFDVHKVLSVVKYSEDLELANLVLKGICWVKEKRPDIVVLPVKELKGLQLNKLTRIPKETRQEFLLLFDRNYKEK